MVFFLKRYILCALFVVAVIVDALNGFFQLSVHIDSPIGVAYRGAIYVFLFYSFICNLQISHQLIIFFFLTLLLSVWCLFYNASLFYELNFIIRFSYVFLLFTYFQIHWKNFTNEELYKYCTLYGSLISFVIVFSFVLGIGHSSYGDDFGWGTTGLFIAQNDLALTIVCTLIMACMYYNKYNQTLLSLVRLFFIALGGILTGTRVCFIAIPITLAIQGCFIIRLKGHIVQKILLTLLLIIVLPIVGWLIYLALDSYALAKLTIESMGNARTYLVDYAKAHISTFDELSFFIGKGVGNLQHYVARGYSGFEYKMVEADLYEIIGAYGFFVGIIIISFYLYVAYISIVTFCQNRDKEYFFCALLLILYVVIGYFAGHAATNVMAAPIYAIVANRILTLDKRRIVRIVKK